MNMEKFMYNFLEFTMISLACIAINILLYKIIHPGSIVIILLLIFLGCMLSYPIIFLIFNVIYVILTRELTDNEWLSIGNSNLYHYTSTDNRQYIESEGLSNGNVFLKCSSNRVVNASAGFNDTLYLFKTIPNVNELNGNLLGRRNDCKITIRGSVLRRECIRIKRFEPNVLLYHSDYIGLGTVEYLNLDNGN